MPNPLIAALDNSVWYRRSVSSWSRAEPERHSAPLAGKIILIDSGL